MARLREQVTELQTPAVLPAEQRLQVAGEVLEELLAPLQVRLGVLQRANLAGGAPEVGHIRALETAIHLVRSSVQ